MLFKFWQFSKPIYLACLIPVAIYFFLTLFHVFFGNSQISLAFSILPLALCVAFFVLGLFVFLYMPVYFRRRIMHLAYRYEDAEDLFILEEWEVLSSNYKNYLGFDCKKKTLLFVESMPVAGIAFGFEDIAGFEITAPPKGDALFTIVTNNMRCPLIRFSIPGRRAGEWEKKMAEIFRIRVSG